MSVGLASRISAFLLAATIVTASWAPTLASPPAPGGHAPVVAAR